MSIQELRKYAIAISGNFGVIKLLNFDRSHLDKEHGPKTVNLGTLKLKLQGTYSRALCIKIN